MAKICPNCNKQCVDEAIFCTECGTNLDAAPAQPSYQQAPPAYQPQPVYQPQPEYNGQELYPAVKTSVYFWLNIAMAIPFVGFILSIVLTCAPKNKSLKNYAKAYLIANLIIIGLAVVFVIVSVILGVSFADAVIDSTSMYGW